MLLIILKIMIAKYCSTELSCNWGYIYIHVCVCYFIYSTKQIIVLQTLSIKVQRVITHEGDTYNT